MNDVQINRVFSYCAAGVAATVMAFGGLSAPASAQSLSASQLSVEVNGIRNQGGQLCFSVFNSQRGFPSRRDDAVRSQCISATANPLRITFDGLAPGSYSVAVLHDSNSDNVINRNFLGIPREGFGFSGNPPIRPGLPDFGETLVVVSGRQTNIQIRLNYL